MKINFNMPMLFWRESSNRLFIIYPECSRDSVMGYSEVRDDWVKYPCWNRSEFGRPLSGGLPAYKRMREWEKKCGINPAEFLGNL